MNKTNCLQGVSCDVSDCLYNSKDKLCRAEHIQVANEERKCDEKTDTFCGTFTAK